MTRDAFVDYDALVEHPDSVVPESRSAAAVEEAALDSSGSPEATGHGEKRFDATLLARAWALHGSRRPTPVSH